MSRMQQIDQRFSVRQSDDGKALIFDSDRHTHTMPWGEWETHGKGMIEAWHAGKPYIHNVEFAGQQMDPKVAHEARIELLEKGHDATRAVEPWTRYLAAAEAREGGMLGAALDAVAAEQWPALVREVFDSLYSSEPKQAEAKAAGSEWITELLSQAEGSPEWSKLRDQVQGDQWATGVAAGRVARELADKAKDLLAQLPKQDPERLAQDAQATEELLGPKAKASKEAAKVAVEAAQQAEAVLQLMQEDIMDPAGAVASVLEVAAEKAATEVVEAMQGAGQMADLSSGALRSAKAAPEQMRKMLIENPNLRKLVQLAGRLRIRARAKQRNKTKYVPESIVDVTMGGELERLLPIELGQLVMPETELLLMRKLQEREALQYDLEGEETLERGPVIVAVDSSGSMQGIRNQWAMAVAIAVLEIAAMQKRPFALLHFDDGVKAAFEVPKPSAMKLADLVEMVSYFSGGGTDFRAPLSHAHGLITRGGGKGGVFAKADVMLVTDGMASWGDWAEKVKATGASLYGVAIDCKFSDAMAKELTGCMHVAGPMLHDATADVDLLFGI